MAVITDPQVILFCNGELRPALDRLYSAIRTLQQLAANYASEGLGPLVVGTTQLEQSYIADGSTNPDGTKGDGRNPILGYDVDNAINQCNALLTWVNAQSGMLPAIEKPSVNNTPLF